MECLKILASLEKTNEVHLEVIRVLRRLNLHSEALNYLDLNKENLKNQKLYQESKSELVDLQKIISLIQEIKKNGNFVEEEVELISKSLVENK